MRIVAPSLLVLVGPSASGKSTWASENFEAHQVVSSDALRGLLGESERRFRRLAESGVQHAIVGLRGLGGPEPVRLMKEVIAAF